MTVCTTMPSKTCRRPEAGASIERKRERTPLPVVSVTCCPPRWAAVSMRRRDATNLRSPSSNSELSRPSLTTSSSMTVGTIDRPCAVASRQSPVYYVRLLPVSLTDHRDPRRHRRYPARAMSLRRTTPLLRSSPGRSRSLRGRLRDLRHRRAHRYQVQDRGGQRKTHVNVDDLTTQMLTGCNLLDVVIHISDIMQGARDGRGPTIDKEGHAAHQFVQ